MNYGRCMDTADISMKTYSFLGLSVELKYDIHN